MVHPRSFHPRFAVVIALVALLPAMRPPAAAADAPPRSASPPDARVASDPEAAARPWRHPVDAYPRSVRRWFAGLPAELQYSEVRFRTGDDPTWAQPEFDDSDWTVTGFWDLPARSGIDWVRFRVRLGSDGRGTLPSGLMLSTVRAYEVFWDGVQLGQSGAPGDSAAAEGAGTVDKIFSIPAALLAPGEHVVALRTSSHRCGFPAPRSGFRFLIDSPAALQSKVLREAFVPTLAAGALFMMALASLIMWLLAARRATLLLLGGVCLSGAVMQSLQAVRWFFAYPADWHYPALGAMTALVAGQGVLLVALVVVVFQLPYRRWLLGLLVPALAVVSWLSPARMNLEGVWLLGMAIGVALACAAWAAWRGRRGAWAAVIGVAASGVLLAFEAEDYRASFFLKFLPALLGVIAALALQLHDERREARAAQRAAARLEAELLKQNLQPHFLLNTLAVLTEIVEQDPRSAVTLIDDLADEFRSVARFSAERLISLGQELELCRAHLRVMSVRTGRASQLVATGADESALVPPAVFLTLIENGFAHQRPAETVERTFQLLAERAPDGGQRYVFLSPGEVQPRSHRPAGGTGLRYVRARLEESFPGGWTLTDGPVADGWQTTIEFESHAVMAGTADKSR